MENLYTLQFLYINRYKFLQGWSDYDERVLFSLIRYIIKGSGEFVINGERYHVQSGDILCIPQNAKLISKANELGIEFVSIRFRADIHKYGTFQKLLMIDLPTHIRFREAYTIRECRDLFLKMNILFSQNDVGQKYKLLGELYYLIGTLKSYLKREGVTPYLYENAQQINNKDQRIIQAIEYMTNNLSTPYKVVTIAKMVDLSESQFRVLFKNYTGKNPQTYIYEYKMNMAADLLLKSNLKINEIAFQLGYEDPNYFTRQFKQAYGLSPRAYRNYRN
ncbi:helix-turn-helix domain-containing protein [Staphylococcus pseudintermedius]|nr:helix-turn-helix domain-containing protein [Staphylococcus pseudintermedius]